MKKALISVAMALAFLNIALSIGNIRRWLDPI